MVVTTRLDVGKGYEPVLPVVRGARGHVRGEHLAQAAGARARHRRARGRQQRVAVAAGTGVIL